MTTNAIQRQTTPRHNTVPPGPKGHWLLGCIPAFRRDMLSFLTNCAREYGDVCSFHLGPRRHILVNHPSLIHRILVTDNNKYVRPYNYQFLRSSIGNGLLLNEGKSWMRQRRLMQPQFLRQRLAGYADSAVRITREFSKDWQPGETRDLHTDMMRLTLRIVANVILNIEVDRDAEVVERVLEEVLNDYKFRLETGLNLPLWIPTRGHNRLRKALADLDQLVYRRIAERREHPNKHDDLLSRLVKSHDEGQSGMTSEQLRDEVVTMLFAGHETTANTLTWTFNLLAQHPQVGEQVAEEMSRELGKRDPAAADLDKLKFTEQVLLESMRLYPTAYLLGRKPTEEVQIGDYQIPAGVTIFLSQWVLQRDGRFFDEPEEFQPQRWAEGSRGLPERAYFPFGAGPRLCIGKDFGMMESLLILSALLTCYGFDLVDNQPPTPWPSVTLRPRDGLKVIVRTRDDVKTNSAA